ncbi:MAG: Na+:solute symporter [Nitrospinaceae bacterium]|nr:Na+:solute symporter [Nitrospinaceae bacterium]
MASYFVAGRSLPWWWVGISMVATTFASDTPLVVAGIVASRGISGNWFWWAGLIGSMGVATFFAPLWRRAGVVTDAELVEKRYGPGPGAALRAFKAVYSSCIVNLIVMGWVFRAMGKIAAPFVRWSEILPGGVWAAIEGNWPAAFVLGTVNETVTVALLVLLVGAYASAGGLRGVMLTDLFQFLIALVGGIIFAWIAVAHVGGLSGLVEKLGEIYGAAGAEAILSFTPPSGAEWAGWQVVAVFLFVVWWAHGNADGGGYVAQRLSAAATPKDAQKGMRLFAFANYVIRPWPWILIGLVGLVVFPKGMDAAVGTAAARALADREAVYPLLMAELLPAGLLGLSLVGLLGAFMSTVDTHLNWGASYLVNDLYARFIRPTAGRRELVAACRIGVVLMTLGSLAVASRIGSIEWAWKFNISLGAGLGLPVILRWLWWRTTAWTEAAGMAAAFGVALWLNMGAQVPEFAEIILWEACAGGLAMICATWCSQSVDRDILLAFHKDVRPPGAWGPIRALGAERSAAGEPAAGPESGESEAEPLGRMVARWLLSSLATFGAMFALGALLVGTWAGVAGYAGVIAAACAGLWALHRGERAQK